LLTKQVIKVRPKKSISYWYVITYSSLRGSHTGNTMVGPEYYPGPDGATFPIDGSALSEVGAPPLLPGLEADYNLLLALTWSMFAALPLLAAIPISSSLT
jgi:hypothetical protein